MERRSAFSRAPVPASICAAQSRYSTENDVVAVLVEVPLVALLVTTYVPVGESALSPKEIELLPLVPVVADCVVMRPRESRTSIVTAAPATATPFCRTVVVIGTAFVPLDGRLVELAVTATSIAPAVVVGGGGGGGGGGVVVVAGWTATVDGAVAMSVGDATLRALIVSG